MHDDLLAALRASRGLIFLAGSAGSGKTTAIDAVLTDPACAPGVHFLGDVRNDLALAQQAVSLARTSVVIRVSGTEPILLHEKIVVSDPIRALIVAGADSFAIRAQAVAEGMTSLRATTDAEVEAGRLVDEVRTWAALDW